MIAIPAHNSAEQTTSIRTPPDRVPVGPVETVTQVLPFGELTWENFERLCYRLANQDSEVEHCARYGRAGQAQQGIDIFVRKKNGKYDTWQAKRYERYSADDLKSAVTAFLSGAWAKKTETFFIAIQALLSDTKIQDEIERQTERLKAKGVSLKVIGGDALSERMRRYPRLVLDFFGRSWTKAFLGEAANQSLLATLDGEEVAKIRVQLERLYQTQFHLLDRGAIERNDASSGAPIEQERGLLSRFTRPDVLVQELRDAAATKASRKPGTETNGSNEDLAHRKIERSNIGVERSRRVPLAGWLTQSDQLALLGDAGTGKSTVLRCIALDLIGHQVTLPEITSRWGNLIPIYVSFAKWARTTEDAGGHVGLKEVVRASLQPLLTTPDLVGLLDRAIDERRILLLVDGLDEWSNEQAARTALLAILTLVGTHQIPIVATARPRGLDRIGVIPRSWSSGTLAPLSIEQQRLLVLRCLGLQLHEPAGSAAGLDPSINQVAERFFRELKREAGLATLAEIPLLLVSLLALAMRRITLPRDRAKALDQLIDVLLEIHPQGRATAAGDVRARFSAAQDLEVRKGAIAALAFASRLEGRDAGYPISDAKEKIRAYLTDPHTHAFTSEKAMQAANEILAVNAETVGLLVEKGPNEVGFVHASLEEYLSAVHVQGWQLEKLVSFIRGSATNPRWRNVIANLVAITRRTAEIDQFVDAIKSAETDILGESAKRQLLTDIAFAPSRMSPATATSLGLSSIAFIERPGHIKERTDLLSSALNGTSNPVLGPILLERIRIWAPKTLNFAENLFEVLAIWERAPDLLLALERGLCEETRWGRRTAAKAIARVFGGDEEVQEWLVRILDGTTDLETTSAAIEALVLGWSSSNGIEQVIADLATSLSPTLRSMGIWASVKLGSHKESQLFEILALLEDRGILDYRDRQLAAETLSVGWCNHPAAIEECIKSLQRHNGMRGHALDRETSIDFLLGCSPENQSVRNWIVDESKNDHPFLSLHGGTWDRLAPFAQHDDNVKQSLVFAITKKADTVLDYQVTGLIAALQDPRLKSLAIQNVRADRDRGWSQSWNLRALLDGWPLDQDVQELSAEIVAWPDEKLANVAELLPKILPSSQDCRSRLLALHRSQKFHAFHRYPEAFAAIGCDSTDQDVVDELLKAAKSNHYWGGGESLIRFFGASPSVQEFARSCLLERDPPLAAIATAYSHIEDLRASVLARIGTLPISLRYLLAEIASIDNDRHVVMANLLDCYDWEVDGDLKVLLSIRRHEILQSSKGDSTKAIETLLADVRAVGPDHDERRAAAVAGLITFGAMKEFASLRESDKPLDIYVGRYNEESGSLLELIARRWAELKSQLGDELIERIGHMKSTPTVWGLLAPYIAWNEGLRQDFVSYCERANVPLGIPSLRALARERPNSELLERHCLLAIDTQNSNDYSPWHANALAFEAAYILRDQFAGKSNISQRLHARFSRVGDVDSVMILSIYNPDHEVLGALKHTPLEIGAQYARWATACTVSAKKQDSAKFVEVLRAMINRGTHDIWDFQAYTNIAVIERLAHDPNAVEILLRALEGEVTSSEVASLPRYLAAIGPFKESTLLALRRKLDFFGRRMGVPVAGYDAIADEIRPVSHSLLDALR